MVATNISRRNRTSPTKNVTMAAMNSIATVTEASKRNRTALRNPVAMTAQTRSAVVVHS